jgi:hypothetical protein
MGVDQDRTPIPHWLPAAQKAESVAPVALNRDRKEAVIRK